MIKRFLKWMIGLIEKHGERVLMWNRYVYVLQIEKLKNAEKKGPQFAFETSTRAVVELTEKGLRKFKMIYTNRPDVIEKNGHVLRFEWPLLL